MYSTVTTVIGAVLGVAKAVQVDPVKVGGGDTAEIANLVTSIGLVLLGYFTNKQPKEKK